MAEGVPTTADHQVSPKTMEWKGFMMDMHAHYDKAQAIPDPLDRTKALVPLIMPLKHAVALRRGVLSEVAIIFLEGGDAAGAEPLVREHGLLAKAIAGKDSREWLLHLRLQVRLDMLRKDEGLAVVANLIRASKLAAKLGEAEIFADCETALEKMGFQAKAAVEQDANQGPIAMEDMD